jgi:hypothetical protein
MNFSIRAVVKNESRIVLIDYLEFATKLPIFPFQQAHHRKVGLIGRGEYRGR